MKKTVFWSAGVDQLRQALAEDGAFLISSDKNGRGNPMTIGWGEVGFIWGRPVFTVLVRRSRYTYGSMLAADTFTVSVPAPGMLKEELLFCGTKSGRDLDKAAACSITLAKGKVVATPIIAECSLHYECRILLRKQLAGEDFSAPEILERYYADDDHHMLVIGEILTTYTDR